MKRVQIAELFEVDPTSISRWRGVGCPVNRDGTYDAAAVLAWLSRNQNRKPNIEDHDSGLEEPVSLFEMIDSTFFQLLEDNDVVGVVGFAADLLNAVSAAFNVLVQEVLINE